MDFLLDRIEQHTDLGVDLVGSSPGISLEDERLDGIPIIFIDGRQNKEEGEYLARYLLAGGFFIGNLLGDIENALQTHDGWVQGSTFWIEELAEDHPIFRSY